MKARLLLAPLFAAVLAACAPMHSGPVPTSRLDAATVGAVETPVQWPTHAWWQRYGDPQLNRLIDAALAGSPSLTMAQARIAQANAAVGEAEAVRLPQVAANYSLTRQRYSENYIYPEPLAGSVGSDNRLALDVSFQLDFWGKNRALFEGAVSEARSAEAEAQAARNVLVQSVATAYYNLQDAFAQREVLQNTIAQREAVTRITRDRVAAGLDTQVEVRQAESALATARVQQERNEANLERLRHQVAALVGAGPQAGDALQPVALRTPGAEAPANLPLELLAHRPDVVAARWRAEASGSAIDAAKASFYPNVNLTAFVGLLALGTNRLFDSGSRTAGIGPAISLPIFDAGRLNANLNARRADAELAVADYNQTVLDAARQVADTVGDIRSLNREAQHQREAREAIQAAYDLAVRRYEAGLGNYLTVLAAQDAVLAQTRLDTEIAARRQVLDVQLATALGGGYDDTIAPTR